MAALVDQQITYSSEGPMSCSSCLPFLGVTIVSCHSAVQLCLLLYDAISSLVCQFLFYFI